MAIVAGGGADNSTIRTKRRRNLASNTAQVRLLETCG